MKISNSKLAVAALVVTLVSGCSIFPYDSHYLCEATDDYGHCTSVQGAYKDALNGTNANAAVADRNNPVTGDAAKHRHLNQNPQGEGDGMEAPADQQQAMSAEDSAARNLYRDSEYRAMAGLVERPVAPIVAAPRVLRTLVVAYEDGETLYMQRFVYTLVDKPHFVLGDYLSRPQSDEQTVFPNGPSAQLGGR